MCVCAGIVEVGLVGLILVGCRRCYRWAKNKVKGASAHE